MLRKYCEAVKDQGLRGKTVVLLIENFKNSRKRPKSGSEKRLLVEPPKNVVSGYSSQKGPVLLTIACFKISLELNVESGIRLNVR